MNHNGIEWHTDHLGKGFEMAYVSQPDDYSGSVRITVIRIKAKNESRRAVLYIHGFSDYFFQKEMAEMFAYKGYNFYAVDLRKYGRSLTERQKMFQVRNLHEYFSDINATVDIILSDGNSKIALLGHSTGGLTSALYMTEKPSPYIKALMLNSPFLDWNLPAFIKKAVIPAVSFIGHFIPNMHVKQKPDSGYAESLSTAHGGEWTYRTDWKPDILPNPDMGWIRAIDIAQKQLRHRKINVPVLLMHSDDSVRNGDSKEKYNHADAILDVKDISCYGRRLGNDVTEISFRGALHDIALSRKSIRDEMYDTMISWLKERDL